MNRTTRTARRGFTLVEGIASMVIIATLGSLAGQVVFAATRAYSRAATQAQLHSELSVALDRVVRELHNIRGIAGSTVTPDITSLTPTSMTWNTNSTLTLVSGELRLAESGGAAAPLLQGVTSLAITATDENNGALGSSLSGSQCNPVRRIQIQATVSRSGVSDTLRARVYLRNLLAGAGGQ